MEFDYYAYDMVERDNADGYGVNYDRLARVTVAGIDVYIDAHRAHEYGLDYAAPEEIPVFLNDRYLDVQRDNGFGFLVYVTDDVHFEIIAPVLSALDGIETASVTDNGSESRRWVRGKRYVRRG